MKDYVQHFHPSIRGLSGTEEQLQKVTAQYSTTFGYKGDPSTDEAYTVVHSSNLLVLDRTGAVSHMVPFGLPVDFLLESLEPLWSNH